VSLSLCLFPSRPTNWEPKKAAILLIGYVQDNYSLFFKPYLLTYGLKVLLFSCFNNLLHSSNPFVHRAQKKTEHLFMSVSIISRNAPSPSFSHQQQIEIVLVIHRSFVFFMNISPWMIFNCILIGLCVTFEPALICNPYCILLSITASIFTDAIPIQNPIASNFFLIPSSISYFVSPALILILENI